MRIATGTINSLRLHLSEQKKKKTQKIGFFNQTNMKRNNGIDQYKCLHGKNTILTTSLYLYKCDKKKDRIYGMFVRAEHGFILVFV